MLLNGKTLNVVILNGGPGRVVLKPVTASSTSTATFGPFRFGKLISYVATTTATVTNSVRKTFTYLSTSSKSLVTGLVRGKVLTTTIQNSVSSIVRQILANKTIVSTSTASIIKRIEKSFNVFSTSIAAIINFISKKITTNINYVLVVLLYPVLRILIVNYLSTSSTKLIKNLSKQIATTALISTTTIIKLITRVLTLTIFSTSLTTLGTLLGKLLATTSTSFLNIIKYVSKGVSYTSTSSLLIVKKVSKTILTNINYILAVLFPSAVRALTINCLTTASTSLARAVNKLIVATQSIVTTLVYGFQFFRTIATNTPVVFSFTKRIFKSLQFNPNTINKLIKRTRKILPLAVVSNFVKLRERIKPLFGFPSKFKIYYQRRNKLNTRIKKSPLFVSNLKNRLIALVKVRSVNKTKDLNG
jgi:hypothetical protein